MVYDSNRIVFYGDNSETCKRTRPIRATPLSDSFRTARFRPPEVDKRKELAPRIHTRHTNDQTERDDHAMTNGRHGGDGQNWRQAVGKLHEARGWQKASYLSLLFVFVRERNPSVKDMTIFVCCSRIVA